MEGPSSRSTDSPSRPIVDAGSARQEAGLPSSIPIGGCTKQKSDRGLNSE